MSLERRSFGEKVAEISKKVDVISMAVGGVLFFFNPAVGGVIIAGSAVTWFAVNEYQKRKQRKSVIV